MTRITAPPGYAVVQLGGGPDIRPLNAVIWPRVPLAKGIVVRFVDEPLVPGVPPRTQLVLEINESTDYDSISIHRREIQSYYEWIVYHEGSDLKSLRLAYIASVYLWRHNHKVPWSMLPKLLNYIGAGLLLAAEAERRQSHSLYKVGQALEDGALSEPDHFVAAERALINIFQEFGLKDRDIASRLDKAHKAMSRGVLPWAPGKGPFKVQKVRDKIRNFEKNVRSRRILIPEEARDFNSLELVLSNLRRAKYLTTLDARLKRNRRGRKADGPKIRYWVDKFIIPF